MDGNWQVEFTKPGPTVYSNGFSVFVYRSDRKHQPQKRDGNKGGGEKKKGSYLGLPVNWGGIQTIAVFCIVIRSLERIRLSSGSSSSD